jgi:predicted nucleic-acid-binding protein
MNARPAYLADTNLLLRFLLADHPVHSPAARKFFLQATTGRIELRIPLIAITETVFTLQSYYKVPRGDIGTELLKILTGAGIKLTCPTWILQAIDDYRTRNVSFGDACLAAEARANRVAVASFDRGLDKFPGLKRHEPKA